MVATVLVAGAALELRAADSVGATGAACGKLKHPWLEVEVTTRGATWIQCGGEARKGKYEDGICTRRSIHRAERVESMKHRRACSISGSDNEAFETHWLLIPPTGA